MAVRRILHSIQLPRQASRVLPLLLGGAAIGCTLQLGSTSMSGDGSSDPSSSGSTASDDAPDTGTATQSHQTSLADSTGTADAASSSDAGTSSGGAAMESDTGSTGGSCVGELPDDAACASDCDCSSGHCTRHVIALCGACSSDADCPGGGCTGPRIEPPQGGVCHTGELGGGCETDAACGPGLRCVDILIATSGLSLTRTCGECESDDDCPGSQVCAPTYDLPGFGGFMSCVEPGSVSDGGGCIPEIGESSACASGRCSEAEWQASFLVGVCGACLLDSECSYPQVCSGPHVDADFTVHPAVCVDKG